MIDVLIDIAVIVTTAHVLGAVLGRFGQPPVIGELLAGIALGPTVLGALPGLDRVLFPLRDRPSLSAIAEVGLVVFMLLVGLELEATSIRGRRRSALTVSAASLMVPFALGTGVALPLHGLYGGSGRGTLAFALFLGTAVSVTALPVLARLLTESGLGQTPLGGLALACAGLQDAATWTLLAASLGVATAAGPARGATVVAEGAALVAGLFLLAHPALRWACATLGEESAGSLIALVVVGAAGAAAASDAIGLQPVIGAFAFGAAFPRGTGLRPQIRERLAPLTQSVLLPIYFFLPGLSIDLRQFGAADLGALLLVLIVACAGKLAGATAAARRTGLQWREAAMLGALLNTRGLVELVVLNAGLSAGILDRRLYGVLVIVAVTTTLMTTPLLRRLERGAAAAASGQRDRHGPPAKLPVNVNPAAKGAL